MIIKYLRFIKSSDHDNTIAYNGEYNLSSVKNNIINHAQLHWSDQSTPFSLMFNDIFFNTDQGLRESQYVFFDGNNLSERWQTYKNKAFCIAETGFGSGLNFFNTVEQFLHFKKQNRQSKLQRLHFITFEKYPFTKDDIKKALRKYPQLNELVEQFLLHYPPALIGCHRLDLFAGQITLDLWLGDINQQLPQISNNRTGYVDAWYLDGFNPSHNPDMWQQSLFDNIYRLSTANATLATFTAAGFVRRGLIASGFVVKKRKGFAKKREMLVATTKSKQKKADISHDIAIIGGGIAGLTAALSLASRGDQVTIYCSDTKLGQRASGNLQGALYPLLNEQHDSLSQLFCNAYYYALHFYKRLNIQYPFPHQFNGLIQLAYDHSATNKLKKINQAGLPKETVNYIDKTQCNKLAGVTINQEALFYPQAGWLSPKQMISSLVKILHRYPNVKIICAHKIQSIIFTEDKWLLHNEKQNISHTHDKVIIAAAMDSLNFEQCRAVPLSAARGQVTHIESNQQIGEIKRTLCHEGYLTPAHNNRHCMGATFKRHQLNVEYHDQEQLENLDKLKKCIPEKDWVDSITLSDQAHVAVRCTTRDHFPYLGPVTDYNLLKQQVSGNDFDPKQLKNLQNLYLFTGLGSRGLCTAPLLAEVLASQIHQECIPVSQDILNKMQIPRQWLNYIRKEKPLKE